MSVSQLCTCVHKCLCVFMLFVLCFCLNINPVRRVSVGIGTSDMYAKPNSKHISLANELQSCASWLLK